MITFYSNNLVNQAESIEATNSNALYPVNNINDPRRTKVLRTTTNSDSVVFDFGETSEINSIIIVDSLRDGFGVTTATLELSATNEFSSPLFSIVVQINITHGFAFASFPIESARFARLVLTSSLGYCELSKVFIGKSIEFENGMGIDLGWTYQDKENAIIKENRYGQKFVDVISRQKQISFSLRSMDKNELDQIFEIYDDKGITKPFFVRIGDTSMINDPDRFAGMFYLNSIPQVNNKSFGLYDMSMSLEEAT
jgi:hypothetical protein